MFNAHSAAVRAAGYPYASIHAQRGFDGGFTFLFFEQDFTGETLNFVISLGPNHPVLQTISVGITTETNTWQYYLDGKEISEIPCDVVATDSVTVTVATVFFTASSFVSLPYADTYGEPVNFYSEIRRANKTAQPYLCADFILREAITA